MTIQLVLSEKDTIKIQFLAKISSDWRNKVKRILLTLVVSALIICLAFASVAFYLLNRIDSSIQQDIPSHREVKDINYQKLKDHPFNILLLGVDTGDLGRNDKGRSDTMMIIHADLKKNTYTLMSIERDILVNIPDYHINDKLNSAYAYGGADCAVKTVENFLKIKVPFFVSINMGGAKKLLEQAGPINVKNDFAFSEEGFDFPQGTLSLTPDKALVWARMRHEDPRGDYGRQLRQQELLKAIINNLTQAKSIGKLNTFTTTLSDNIKTNLSLKEFFINVPELLNKPTITSDQIEGQELLLNGISYQKISLEELNRVSGILK
ncbi:LCP family protein [Lactococcus lactis]|uniref:LCP family protein n=1 Tax=Lactococcus lactis TaxID=1358 RepID=UPI001D186FAF|nr:LCP family protein [Lactococcus lactis]MCC4121470.1 LCP family protein [Lactococcus lactis]